MSDIQNQAIALLSRLKADYINELPSKVDELEWLLMELLNHAGSDRFQELYRSVHSLKGSAGTHGLAGISMVCHYFEDAIQACLNNGGECGGEFNDWLQYIDILRKIIQQGDVENHDAHRQWFERLQNVPSQGHENISVLVVEASKSLIKLIEGIYPKPLYRIIVSDNGLKALEKLLVQQFHLLITSKEVTGLNGYAVIQALRHSHSVNRHITTVLLTSSEGGETQFAGVDYVIQKDNHLPAKLAGISAEHTLRSGPVEAL